MPGHRSAGTHAAPRLCGATGVRSGLSPTVVMQYRVSPRRRRNRMPSYVDEAAPLMSDEFIATLLGLGVRNPAGVQGLRRGDAYRQGPLGPQGRERPRSGEMCRRGQLRSPERVSSDRHRPPAHAICRSSAWPSTPASSPSIGGSRYAIERAGAGATVDFHASRSRQTVSA